MRTLLNNTFLAVDCEGQELVIRDLPQLIQDYGIRRFFESFGLSHGKVLSRDSLYPYERWKGYGRIQANTKKLVSEIPYVIYDIQGKRYAPEYLFGLYCEQYPKAAEALLDKSYYYHRNLFGFKSCKTWRQRQKYKCWGKIPFLRQDISLKEEGTKGIRNLHDYSTPPYDDPYYRENQRCWKSQRKTQYRNK